ncbi:hypothetical protein TorRG33x02_218800 [Trema orientale]|uniref:Uncharacterized protein n=1 Tax=Trema orientale TaxID=63057 RepID=A0A2P5EA03_TREOI|nr:hypothetical protein TorRG33x02_218800 [Trema orientale]
MQSSLYIQFMLTGPIGFNLKWVVDRVNWIIYVIETQKLLKAQSLGPYGRAAGQLVWNKYLCLMKGKAQVSLYNFRYSD